MPWTTIINVAMGLIGWLIKRAEKKDRAEKVYAQLIKRMDKITAESAEFKRSYEKLKTELSSASQDASAPEDETQEHAPED